MRWPPWRKREITGPPPWDGTVPRRGSDTRGTYHVTNDSAMRHSAVWACLRLRADLMSTFPCDVFRTVAGIDIEVPKPPILVDPGGEEWDYLDWMYASQVDLDRAGNTIGLITEVNALGLPARIDLKSSRDVTVIRYRDKGLRYRIGNVEYTPDKVWHERQFPVSGLDVGLSPIAYAAWTISEHMSIQQFALDWFGGGAVPKARLRNTKQKLDDDVQARRIKDRYKASMSNGDIFVHGFDWEYDLMQAEAMGMEWLEARRYGLADIARFFGAPADLIEAAVSSGGNITYASISQRNLQFLIMNLGAAVVRREKRLSNLLPRPRFVKLNTDALLRMDPEQREKVIRSKVESKQITITEARALDNRPPYTPEQMAELETFAKLGAKIQPPQKALSWDPVNPYSGIPANDWAELSTLDS